MAEQCKLPIPLLLVTYSTKHSKQGKVLEENKDAKRGAPNKGMQVC